MKLDYNAYAEACVYFTQLYQSWCRDDAKQLPPNVWPVMDLLNINREINQGEGK